ncbi:MAG: SMC-Scp complex subunit ScpB [Chloroflexi bacterium]|nr:SMC-Scp complex subunit ScpB [Chloroflexota bacterium]
MELEEAKSAIEALLFVAGEPTTIRQLARTLRVSPQLVEEAITSLAEDYQGKGLVVQRDGQKVQMATAPRLAEQVEHFLGLQRGSKLSAPALETLAIIAYRQPITRAEIESLRGVDCSAVLHNLMARGLVAEVGRLEKAGLPILYGTTFEFLQHFGLQDLSELPRVEELAPPSEETQIPAGQALE